MKEYLLPAKIIDSNNTSNTQALFRGKGFYVNNLDTQQWQKHTKMSGLGASLTLDFGKEMHGGVRLLTGSVSNRVCKVRIRFGESLGEVNSSVGEKNSTNDHSPRDFEMPIPALADITVGQTGFRFVKIDVLEDKNIFFKNIYCENNTLSKKPIYVYQGKDTRIAEIFEAAKRTIDLCSSSGYIWDGVKRDRLVWAGDLGPEVMALSTLYGRTPVVERSLNFVKKLAPYPEFMNGIYTYSLWWIIILADYYTEFGCKNYIKKHLPYIVGLLDLFDGLVDEKGELNKEIRYLVDWATSGTEDELVGVRAIFIMAMNKAVALLKDFGTDTQKAENIRKRLLLQPMRVQEKKQVIALKYFALGEISDEEYEKLTEGRTKGFSTFMSYYVLTAIASRDEALAIELMKEFYGAMLDRGATTFWEEFDTDWLNGSGRIDELDETKKEIHGDYGDHCYIGYRHSLCHGWSAGVIKFIKEYC